MSRSTRLQSCNRGNRWGTAPETAKLLHSMLVFHTFTIKSVSTVKLMHPYCVEMELWDCAKGCFVRREETGFLRREAELNLTNETRSWDWSCCRVWAHGAPESQTVFHLGWRRRPQMFRKGAWKHQRGRTDGRTGWTDGRTQLCLFPLFRRETTQVPVTAGTFWALQVGLDERPGSSTRNQSLILAEERRRTFGRRRRAEIWPLLSASASEASLIDPELMWIRERDTEVRGRPWGTALIHSEPQHRKYTVPVAGSDG